MNQFSMNGGRAPIDGPHSSLAGVAEPGDRLDVFGWGSYVNAGTKESPRWERLPASQIAPSSSAGAWRRITDNAGAADADGAASSSPHRVPPPASPPAPAVAQPTRRDRRQARARERAAAQAVAASPERDA